MINSSVSYTYDDDCIPPRDTSPHQEDSTVTALSGTPPPAQPPPHYHRHGKHSPTARKPHSNHRRALFFA